MRKLIFIIAALLGLASTTKAQTDIAGVRVYEFKMEHNGKFMAVELEMGLATLKIDANRATLLTPRLVNGTDSLDLPSVGIYGRRRYYFYVRNGESMLTGKEEKSYKASEKPNHIAYSQVLPYEEWMNGASLSLHRSDYGCCNTLLAEEAEVLGMHAEAREFFPQLVYIRPQAEKVKSRAIEGSAIIDFPVNKTEIRPEYRRNIVELGKIQGTIDSVRNDRDVTITSVWLKGYASPEGSYAHNKQLAIGRTEALKSYIAQLYRFDDSVMATDSEPEDWEGLRRYVEQSGLEHKLEILSLIDSEMEPDAKELKIKRTYPAEYRLLLQDCYPALRHTDYRIAYNIRSYSNVEEIRKVMREQPQKLSLNEFYLVAQTCEPGTEEFTEVFETAVRMYPADETANLNAANAAMRQGDTARAEHYLAKAGNSPEAVYARGALAIRKQNYDAARSYLIEAERLGLEQAKETLQELENGISR